MTRSQKIRYAAFGIATAVLLVLSVVIVAVNTFKANAKKEALIQEAKRAQALEDIESALNEFIRHDPRAFTEQIASMIQSASNRINFTAAGSAIEFPVLLCTDEKGGDTVSVAVTFPCHVENLHGYYAKVYS